MNTTTSQIHECSGTRPLLPREVRAAWHRIMRGALSQQSQIDVQDAKLVALYCPEDLLGVQADATRWIQDTLSRTMAEMRRYLPLLECAESSPEIWDLLTAGTGIATLNGFKSVLAGEATLIADTMDGDPVFFYERDFYPLSNFSAFNVTYLGRTYPTAEHAYHAMKFRHRDDEACELVSTAPSAHESFALAGQMKHRRRTDWDDKKVSFMTEILRAKLHQHDYVKKKLMDTGDRLLVENSWRDDYWGWGVRRQGQNMLGQLWMKLRNEVRAEQL